jgi:pyruvate dehydrogenase E1 component beta subunit
MSDDILLPAFTKGMEAARLARWNVPEGGWLAEGDVLAEIETEKATMEIEAPADGVLTQRLVEPGPKLLPVGATLGRFAPGPKPQATAPRAGAARLPTLSTHLGPTAPLTMEQAIATAIAERLRAEPGAHLVAAQDAWRTLGRALAIEFPERVLFAPESPVAAIEIFLGVVASGAPAILTMADIGALAADRLDAAERRVVARAARALIVAPVAPTAHAALPAGLHVFAPSAPARVATTLASAAQAPGLSLALVDLRDPDPAPTPLRPPTEPAGPHLVREGTGPLILALGPALAAARAAAGSPALRRRDPAVVDLERLDADPAALVAALAAAHEGVVVDPWPGLGYGERWAGRLTALAFAALYRPLRAVGADPDDIAAALAGAAGD